MKQALIKILISIFLSLTLFQANADVIAVGMSNSGTPFGINGNSTDWTQVIINGGSYSGGAIPIINFDTTENNQLISLTFKGVCSISGSINTYMYLRILVDGMVMYPKNNTLCANRGTTFGIGNDVSTTIAFLNVPYAGTHTLRIDAKIATSSMYPVYNGYGYIYDTTTIINN